MTTELKMTANGKYANPSVPREKAREVQTGEWYEFPDDQADRIVKVGNGLYEKEGKALEAEQAKALAAAEALDMKPEPKAPPAPQKIPATKGEKAATNK